MNIYAFCMSAEATAEMTLRFKLTCTPDLLLGRLLAVLRRGRGLTQAEVAQKVGLSTPAFAALEQGRTGITLPMLDEVGAALGVPGLLVHALHAEAVVELDRAGCPVGGATRRRPRGRAAGTSRTENEKPGRLDLAPVQLDEWLQRWMGSAPLPGAVLGRGEDQIIHPEVEWSPAPLRQRLGRLDRRGRGASRFQIVQMTLGGGTGESRRGAGGITSPTSTDTVDLSEGEQVRT